MTRRRLVQVLPDGLIVSDITITDAIASADPPGPLPAGVIDITGTALDDPKAPPILGRTLKADRKTLV